MDNQGQPRRSRGTARTLWHGSTLRQLGRLAARAPRLDRGHAPRWWTLPLTGMLNSLLAGAERLTSGRRLRRLPPPSSPLFVIGHWGSGAELLLRWLAADPGLQSPTWLECQSPNHLRLTQRWLLRRTHVPSRDGSSPGIDEAALAVLTGFSPCLLAVQPECVESIRPYWDLSLLSPREQRCWQRNYLAWAQRVSGGSERTLVLNSPLSAVRLPLVLEAFPDARFVHLVRHPFEVWSNLRARLPALLADHALSIPQGPDASVLAELISWSQEFTHVVYQRDKRMIPAGRLLELRYENLISDPRHELERIYGHLAHPFAGRPAAEDLVGDDLDAQRQDGPPEGSICSVRLRRLCAEQGYTAPAAVQDRQAA